MAIRKLHDELPRVIDNTEGAHVIVNARTGEVWEADTHEEAHALSSAHHQESNRLDPENYPIDPVSADLHDMAHKRAPYVKAWYAKQPRPTEKAADA